MDRKILQNNNGWIFALIVTLLLLLNFNIVLDIAHRWVSQGFNGPYAHGPLLILIAVYIIVKTVKSLPQKLIFKPSLVGLALLFLSQVVFLVALLVDVDLVEHLLLAFTLMFLLWSMYSYSVCVKFIYPFLVLLLALPIWGIFLPLLQKISLTLTSLFMSTTTIPFYQEEFYLYLSNGTFEVAPGCAGLQQFLVAMILGVLYGYLRMFNFRSLLRLIFFIALIAVILNSIRIFIIVLIGYNTEMTSSIVEEHQTLGWIVFAIGIYLFMYAYERLTKKTEDDSPSTARLIDEEVVVHGKHVIASVVVIAVLVTTPYWVKTVIFSTVNKQKPVSLEIFVPGLIQRGFFNEDVFNWVPSNDSADASVKLGYMVNDQPVFLYVSHFQYLNGDYEPINMTNSWVEQKLWKQIKHENITLFDESVEPITLGLLRIRSPQRKPVLILHGYVVNGHVTYSLLRAKLYMLQGLLDLRYDVKRFSIATGVEQRDTALVKKRLVDAFTSIQWSLRSP